MFVWPWRSNTCFLQMPLVAMFWLLDYYRVLTQTCLESGINFAKKKSFLPQHPHIWNEPSDLDVSHCRHKDDLTLVLWTISFENNKVKLLIFCFWKHWNHFWFLLFLTCDFMYMWLFPGDIPLHITIRETSDRGQPVVISSPNSPEVSVWIYSILFCSSFFQKKKYIYIFFILPHISLFRFLILIL